MRILVIGAGVLGCNVAADLYKAGKEVTLLARGGWYEEIKTNGLHIKNKFSFQTKTYQIPVISFLKAEDIYDVIFVSLRYTQLDSLVATLQANQSKTIVFNGNNLRTQEFAAMFPEKKILFSFALAAGAREEKRVNSIDMKKITIGTLAGESQQENLVQEMFEGTGIKVEYQSNMGDYLLCHTGFVIPVCFACYYTNGNLKAIKRDTEYLGKIIMASRECYRAIEKTGHVILPEKDRNYESEEYYKACMKFMKLMCATSLGKLCVSDHAMHAVDEMTALSVDLEKVLRESGEPTPYFDEIKQSLFHQNN